MKKVLVAFIGMFLLVSSSFACDLCDELAKRGFSPDRLNTALSGGFKADKVRGHQFMAATSFRVDLLVEQSGRVSKNKTVAPLTGKAFYGMLNGQRTRLFVSESGFVGINFVSAPITLAKNTPQTKQTHLAEVLKQEQKKEQKYIVTEEVVEVPPMGQIDEQKLTKKTKRR